MGKEGQKCKISLWTDKNPDFEHFLKIITCHHLFVETTD